MSNFREDHYNSEQIFDPEFDRQITSYLGAVATPAERPEGVYSGWRFNHDSAGRRFLFRSLSEVNGVAFSGKELKGPYYNDFAERLKELDTELKQIDSRFGAESLHAYGYRPEGTPKPRDKHEEKKLLDLYKRKRTYFEPIVARHWARDRDVVIEPGQLDEPPYRRQNMQRSCVGACFSMIFEGLTGDLLSDKEISEVSFSLDKNEIVEQKKLLTVFDTPAYKEKYGIAAKVIQFIGMDLASIQKIGQGMHAKDERYRVFCVLNLASEAALDANVWHNGVLLESDEDAVTYHDPSFISRFADPRKRVAKSEFLERWAAAYNTGYMVIAHRA